MRDETNAGLIETIETIEKRDSAELPATTKISAETWADIRAAYLAGATAREVRRRWGVPDSLDGRFEMLALHLYVLFRRLKGAEMPELAQTLYDSALRDLDRARIELFRDLVIFETVQLTGEPSGGA